MTPTYFVCVCGLCGCGISFSGASNISALVNYMYTISTALTCTRGTQTGSLAKTLSAITPSGSRPVSRDISSYPIKETVKSRGEFSFRQLSRVLQGWRRAMIHSFPARLSSNVEYRPGNLKLIPSTNRAIASSNHLNRPWYVSPARVRLVNQQMRSLGFACAPKNDRMNVYEI